MFVPDAFKLSDPAIIEEVIEGYDFALLVTARPGAAPVASHIPVIFEPENGPHGRLLGHLARANPQWRDLASLAAEGGEALVIFQGPHAYVSPRWYGASTPQVPTWNYLAVHAYGPPRLIEGLEPLRDLLDRLAAKQEAGEPNPWRLDDQPEDFIAGMARGIVGFEIPVSRLDAKAKLSQNKASEAARGAAAALATQDDPLARETARHMTALLDRD